MTSLITTFHAEFCLEGSRLVVDPGVDDPAVVTALVAGQAAFLLQDGHAELRVAEGDLAGGCGPHDAAPNYNHIVFRSTKVQQKESIAIDNIIYMAKLKIIIGYSLPAQVLIIICNCKMCKYVSCWLNTGDVTGFYLRGSTLIRKR